MTCASCSGSPTNCFQCAPGLFFQTGGTYGPCVSTCPTGSLSNSNSPSCQGESRWIGCQVLAPSFVPKCLSYIPSVGCLVLQPRHRLHAISISRAAALMARSPRPLACPREIPIVLTVLGSTLLALHHSTTRNLMRCWLQSRL